MFVNLHYSLCRHFVKYTNRLLLTVQDLDFHFGGRTLYNKASLQIHPGDHIGIVGPNGAGKSTLLRIINQEYTPDGGYVSRSSDCTLGFLNQDLLSIVSAEPVLEVVMQAFARELEIEAELEDLYAQMAEGYTDEMGDKMAALQSEFDLREGYSIRAKAEAVLEGLGFSTAELKKPLNQFSGGWRMRAKLAKLLLQKPSLLMLDEPTNHLDLPTIEWVENYLKGYPSAFIVVSHDQRFLNQVCEKIVEVNSGKLDVYVGNYDNYIEEKALRADIQQKAYDNQQSHIKQMEQFVSRFRAKATKAKQVQSRVKALDKLDKIEQVENNNAELSIRFTVGEPSGKEVVEMKNITKEYPGVPIFKGTDALIQRGDKIALIGANGRGKSTLLRIMQEQEPVQSGEVKVGYKVKANFFAQHQLEALNLNQTILEELSTAGSQKTETELRTILGCFLFSGDDVHKTIKVLSGGEKSRVALAKTLISQANFLLLDEPTNHLDIMSVNILVQSLQQYEGTMVVVSHDRHFVSQVATKIWWIENGKLKEYLGSFEEYKYWQEQQDLKRKAQENQKAAENKADKKDKKKNRQPDSEETKKIKQQLKEQKRLLNDTEHEITKLEKKQKEYETLLADPDLYNDSQKAEKTQLHYADLQKQLSAINQSWEQLAEKIDELEAELS